MANPWAGEVRIRIDGADRDLKLTLGALAELEAELGADSLVDLVRRFETGAYRSRDVIALIVAGLRGAGWSADAGEIGKCEIEGGPMEAARVAALLLARAFSLSGEGQNDRF
jgi:hypothetical protein